MKPLVTPASTVNGSVALMGANVLVWALKQFNIELPGETAFNIVGLIIIVVMHFTPDTPPAPVAREAVEEAAERGKK